MRFPPLALHRTVFDWTRAYICGVVNVTPDSFSDGGRYGGPGEAVAHGLALAEQGADLIDVGGESTRPGAALVSAAEEMERVVPVVRGLALRGGAPVSVDTTKAEVARAALEAGAEIVNDISGGAFDPALVDVCAEAGAAYVCGHARGSSIAEVHDAEREPPTFDEVAFELGARVARLPASLRRRTIVDPGLGFGKRTPQNLQLSRRAGELGAGLACPVMVGPSRKRFLGEVTGRPVGERDGATVGAALAAVACGAQIVRVHEVAALAPALAVFQAVMRAEEVPAP